MLRLFLTAVVLLIVVEQVVGDTTIRSVSPSIVSLHWENGPSKVVVFGNNLDDVESAEVHRDGEAVDAVVASVLHQSLRRIIVGLSVSRYATSGEDYELVFTFPATDTRPRPDLAVPLAIVVQGTGMERLEPGWFDVGNLHTDPMRLLPATRLITVAAVGDSYMAGEGNPDTPWNGTPDHEPIWGGEFEPVGFVGDGAENPGPFGEIATPATYSGATSEQCHRSMVNATTIAMNRLNETAVAQGELSLYRQPRFLIKYRSFACSGSTVNVGLRGPYAGVGHRSIVEVAFQSQIDQVEQWLADEQIEQLDVLIVGIGGNDVAFPRVVENSVKPGPLQNADRQKIENMVQWGDPTDGTRVIGLNNLAHTLLILDDEIRDRINPKHIIVMTYPEPTRDGDGTFCHDFDEGFIVSSQHLELATSDAFGDSMDVFRDFGIGASTLEIQAAELQWVEDNLITPLNESIRSVAEQRNWVLVDGLRSLTRGHGYCSDDPWFHTLKSSWETQKDLKGTAHPNRRGHEAMATAVETAVIQTLDLSPAPPPRIVSMELRRRNDSGNEVFETHIVHDNYQCLRRRQRKRIVVDVGPTVHTNVQVRIKVAFGTSSADPLEDAVTLLAQQHLSALGRLVFSAVVEGTENLEANDWFTFQPEIRYSGDYGSGIVPGEVYLMVNGFAPSPNCP